MHAPNAIDAATPSHITDDSIAEAHASFLQSMTAAVATVAWADGRLHPAERSQLDRYARRCLAQTSARRWKVLALFDEKIRRLRRDQRQSIALLQDLDVLAGTPRASLVLRAAEMVAAADGDIDQAEIAALTAIRCSLGIPSGNRGRFAACMLWGFAAHTAFK